MKNKKNLLSKEATTKQNRIWVRISAACNNICIFCLDSDAQDGKLIPEAKVKKEIYEWWKKGFENRIIISGWEASINPKFPEYIKYAKKCGYDRIQTVTNGNMFASEVFCKKVFDAGLQEVTFSFHGHTPSLHNYLVATPGAFQKSLKGLIYVKKHFPHIIINIDIVVNKLNIRFLPDIVKFFLKIWVYEYDILQIIPFGRGFSEYKNQLFYNIDEHQQYLQNTWKLSKIPGMYMWTNRFPAEAFEWYEDLIQDPRKIKSEVMWESRDMFERFIFSWWEQKPHCYWERCNYCFLKQYCHDFIASQPINKLETYDTDFILKWENFPSKVYEKYGNNKQEFMSFLSSKASLHDKLINVPKCLWGSWEYQTYQDIAGSTSLKDYTQCYISDLYRKKSSRCKVCKYDKRCKWIHINFIRSYGFSLLHPILQENSSQKLKSINTVLNKKFPWENLYKSNFSLWHYGRFFDFIKRYISLDDSILEVGCYSWEAVAYLISEWYKHTQWIDKNLDSIDDWKAKWIPIMHWDITEIDNKDFRKRYELIFLVNVIPNIWIENFKSDITSILKSLKTLLSQKGKIIFNCPINLEYRYFDVISSVLGEYYTYEILYKDGLGKDLFLLLHQRRM